MHEQSTTALAAHYAQVFNYLGFFVGGAIITLLVSVFDVTRRTSLRLFAGCVFGGIGAVLTGMAVKDWGTVWMLAAAGIAAVVTENIVLGFLKASKEFSDSPFQTLGELLKSILPNIPGFKRNPS